MTTPPQGFTRSDADALDATDPLAAWRDRFVDPGVVYLDGNSLGMTPRATIDRVNEVMQREWATSLIGSWGHWVDLPSRVGDRLAPVIGAAPGTVVVHDSTTVNIYQAVHAALGLGGPRPPQRPAVIAIADGDFPTDRYVVAGIAAATGATLRSGFDDLDGVDVVLRSLVDYRTAELVNLAGETERAAAHGAMVVWDLSHAVGSVEVDVIAAKVDLAIGCTYKYLNGGPGSPAFTYIRRELHDAVTQPIWGWFAQRDQFEMGDAFVPRADPRRFLAGTPGILGLVAADIGIGITADAGMPLIAAKGRALTTLGLALCDQLGLRSPTPVDPFARGAHVAVSVPRDELDAVHRQLGQRGVIVDRRRPDLIRVGCSPLTTRFVDVFDGMAALADIVRE